MTPVDPAFAAALADRYRIEGELGHGGMAVVYLARDLKHDRPVALKLLRPELAAALGGERFEREIQFATRLQHPHILPVFDSGDNAGRLWFTMPFVEGRSLGDRLRRERQLPVSEAVRIAWETARALDYAHRRGIVHRDIKPENILLTADGDTLVADFGVGRALSESADLDRLTGSGIVVGTPAYMSPEQAAGERDLDGRSDIYSLGCVLYEMLAGEPPFSGPTAQALIARRMTETPRAIRLTRDTVPAALERVTLTLLARAPADRYPTAAAAAEALDACRTASGERPMAGSGEAPTVAVGRRGRRVGRRAWLIAAAVGVAALLALAALLLWRRGATSGTLDESTVAVAPFDVLDPSLAIWHEGLVDLLSRNLDGAGPLRSVPPTTVIRRWGGRADPASAAALGRSTGAGLALYGSLLRAGPDSARLRATLFDVGRGRAIAEWDLGDGAGRIDRLADSLTLRVLGALGRDGDLASGERRTGLGAANLPALKAFLQGEQFYRRTEWDSALGYYRRAVDLDTGFALAHSRQGTALGWARSGFDALSHAEALRAGALNHGLPPRDSLRLAADSLMASLLEAGPLARGADSLWSARLARLFATLGTATARSPDDAEAWNLLGEADAHLGPWVGRSFAQEVAAFDRSIALDSAFGPAYIHPVEVTAEEGPDAMRRYLDPYLAHVPRDARTGGLRLVSRILDSLRARGTVRPAMLEGANAGAVFLALESLQRLPDSTEAAIALARALPSAPDPEPPLDDPAFLRIPLSAALQARGHLAAGFAALRRTDVPLFAELALLGAVPAESASAVFRGWLSSPDPVDLASALPWWSGRRDAASLRAAAARADALARLPAAAHPAAARYIAASARAYLALERADTAEALDRFLALPAGGCPSCYLDRLTVAQLLVELGRNTEAWAMLQGELPPSTLAPFPSEILWTLLRGRVAERVGERDAAIRSFAWVAGMWRRPDPRLVPYATEAREGLARLTREAR